MISKLTITTSLFAVLPLVGCGSNTATDPAGPGTAKADAIDCSGYKAPDGTEKWMAWEEGIDVAGMTEPGLPMPNVIVHVAKMVHTPAGSAPSGMIFYQPDPKGAPAVMGFVSSDPAVAAYFGPNIFAGTPFEQAPALTGDIVITSDEGKVSSRTEVGGHVFEVEMTTMAAATPIAREPGQNTPFTQKGTEAGVEGVIVKVDGTPVEMAVLPVGIAGGPGAVWAPCGVYTR